MNCIEIFNNIKCEFNHLAGDYKNKQITAIILNK